MSNLSRRLRKLEAGQYDSAGLVPHSEAWFEFWEDKLARSLNGEEVDLRGLTLAVVDRLVEKAERAAQVEQEHSSARTQ